MPIDVDVDDISGSPMNPSSSEAMDTQVSPPSTSSPSPSSSTLTYRIATQSDYPFLVQLRKECGWGLPKLGKTWNDPNVVYCVLQLKSGRERRKEQSSISVPSNSDDTGQTGEIGSSGSTAEVPSEDVGMGCWMLEHSDEDMASKATRTVYLSSLYIRQSHQHRGLGTLALGLLEDVAINRFNAKWLTLDTTAYHCSHVVGGSSVQDFTRPGKSVGWYNRSGYKQFKDIKEVYPNPTPEEPGRLLWAIFMRKSAAPTDGEDDKREERTV